MSFIKISELTEKVTLAGTEEVLINDSGTSKKMATQRFLDVQTAAEAAQTAAELAETNAETAETNAAASASAASTSATNAANSASAASTSASNASASATAASNAQSAAETARDQTLTAFDNFDDRYLGTKASDPALDNDGNALVAGALYFNSTDGEMKVYDGSQWLAAYASLSGALLATNNLSDLNDAATARTNLGLGSAATTASTDYATAAQGSTADSAVQPGDNVSDLTNDAGYLTSFTETDPVVGAITGIVKADGAGNISAAVAGTDYLASYTETDPVFGASEAASITSTDTSNWDTAYGWGNHASAGYLTGITGQSIKNLSDVYSSMSPSDGQILTYDTTNGWQAENAPASYTSWSFTASDTQAINDGETVIFQGGGDTSVTNSGNTITITTNAPSAFPSGTAMVFNQTSAPTGWTKSTSHNDKALRVVSGTVGSGGTHGLSSPPSTSHTHTGPSHTHSFSTTPTTSSSGSHDHSHTLSAASHTLTLAQSPSHRHSATMYHSSQAGAGFHHGDSDFSRTNYTGYQGSSGSHSHSMSGSISSAGAHTHTVTVSGTTGADGTGNTGSSGPTAFAPLYVDVIIATKD